MIEHFSDALFEGLVLSEAAIEPKYLNIIKVVAGPNAVIPTSYGKDGDVIAAATVLRKDEKLFQAMMNRFNSFSHNGIKMKATDMSAQNKDMLDDGEYMAYVEVFLEENEDKK